MAFTRSTPVVAANDTRNPPNVGLITGRRPNHRIATLDPRESEDIEIYVVAWPVGGQLVYGEVAGVNLRKATKDEVAAAVDAFKADG